MKRWVKVVVNVTVLLCSTITILSAADGQHNMPTKKKQAHSVKRGARHPYRILTAGTYTPISVLVTSVKDDPSVSAARVKFPHTTRIMVNGKGFTAKAPTKLSVIPKEWRSPIQHGDNVYVWIRLQKIDPAGSTKILLRADRIYHSNTTGHQPVRGDGQSVFDVIGTSTTASWGTKPLVFSETDVQTYSTSLGKTIYYIIVSLKLNTPAGKDDRGATYHFIASNEDINEKTGEKGIYADTSIKVDSGYP
jgi:hypothetical protein